MMHNPPHPGEILRADYIGPLELSATEAARALGVTRTTPELWVNLQTQYDLWQARETDLSGVQRLVSV